MKTLQKGFTLIELMIVVAIIGILAAIAVPAYQDYTIRSRVSEAASLSGATRTAIDVAYSEGYAIGSIQTTPSSLNLSTSTSYKGKYVTSVTFTKNGLVTVTLGSDKSLGAAKAKSVVYSPIAATGAGNIKWNIKGSVPTKYRPKS